MNALSLSLSLTHTHTHTEAQFCLHIRRLHSLLMEHPWPESPLRLPSLTFCDSISNPTSLFCHFRPMNSGTSIFFLHQFPNVYKIANTKTNFLSGMVQTEMRVISSIVIKFPYSDARSQGPQGVLRSHLAPNNQICNAATDPLRWQEARILCQGQP